MNLKNAYDMFIFDRETYCSKKTINNYKNTLKYMIEFFENQFGKPSTEIDMNDITLMDIKGYVVMLKNRNKLENHPCKPTVNSPVTNTTIRTYSIDVRSFFNFCYQEEIIERNIMKNFKLQKRENKMIIPLYQDEVDTIDKLFNLKTQRGLRNYLIFHLMLDCGLRSGEVIGLTLEAVDLEHRLIIVYNGKGNKDRVVPMPMFLRKYLNTYILMYRPFCNRNNLFLSLNTDYVPITDSVIKNLFARFRENTGITRLKPHLLRHTFATSFIIYGGNLESLRLYLGHSSYSITQNYLHIASVFSRSGSSIYKIDDIFFTSFGIGGGFHV